MFFVIQNNLYSEYGYTQLINVIEKNNIPHVVVKPVPIINRMVPADFDTHAFKGNIEDIPEPFVDETDNVIVMGAVTLAKIGASRNWIPGSFLNDNFDFEVWRKKYGENLLNYDANVCRFDEVEQYWTTFFIRPCEDTKSFSGTVYEWEDFVRWQQLVITSDNDLATLKPDTMVMYTSPKTIYSEYRFFVIDGKIVTQSLYKRGDKVIHDSHVDQDIIDFAQSMINTWRPARAFVIDIALTPSGCKIIEINNLNSAGFYACDVAKIVYALMEMKFPNEVPHDNPYEDDDD
jgi:hypothetical protein